MTVKIQSIDAWKGIGILLVVVGHIIDNSALISRYIFWFHLPLFFFISGYLYKVQRDYLLFFRKKFCSLLIPYISFLILLSLPEYFHLLQELVRGAGHQIISEFLRVSFTKIYGGRELFGWVGVFWFITCLFFTQQIYNWVHCQVSQHKNAAQLLAAFILIAYIIAMIDSYFFRGVKFPWSINAVAIALPFYYFGHLARHHSIDLSKRSILFASLLIFGSAIILNILGNIEMEFNIKIQRYSIGGLNILVALAGISLAQGIAKIVGNVNCVNIFFIRLGEASLIIMYLHQAIQMQLLHYPSVNQDLFRIIVTLAISLFAYQLILNFQFTRKIFLGDFRKSINTDQQTTP